MYFAQCFTYCVQAASGVPCRATSQSGVRCTHISSFGVSRATTAACLSRHSKNQVGAARERQERNACSTLLIVDAQSVKNTDTAKRKGYDAGKKVSGIKRHIAVDTQGLPHAVAVTTAEVTDRKGALQALSRCKRGLERVQSLLANSGYVGQPFAQGVSDILGEHVTVQIAKRSELHAFKVMPKRWVVERSFAWLEKNRRLWKNCERLLNTKGPGATSSLMSSLGS